MHRASGFFAAISLAVISLAASILLVVADEIGGTVRWTHHSGASAAPPLLVASAITAVSLAHPPRRRHALMRLMAALAFMAWGIAQLVPDPGVSAALNDVAILLFVADAGCAMISDARALLTARRKQAPAAQPAPGPARAGQPRRRLPPLPPSRAGVRSRRSRIPSELRAADPGPRSHSHRTSVRVHCRLASTWRSRTR